MATRFYLPSVGAPPISVAPSVLWNRIIGSISRKLLITKSGTPFLEVATTTSATNPEHLLQGQFISDTLIAQTIFGTYKGQVRTRINSEIPTTLATLVRVVSSDGTIERAVLSGINASVSLAIPPSYQGSASNNRNRRMRDASGATDIPIASYDCADGDRIVVEIGTRDASATSGVIPVVAFQDDSATDLIEAEVNAETPVPNNPWIELSANLSFGILAADGTWHSMSGMSGLSGGGSVSGVFR